MAKETESGGGVTITATKTGATIHLKWALIAVLVGGGGVISGRTLFPNFQECATGGEMKKVMAEHCLKQTTTETAQQLQMVELKTKLETMGQDVRDIKQMLMRSQRPSSFAPQTPAPES
jgi:hypothetical protein